jgi:hypothetical protein
MHRETGKGSIFCPLLYNLIILAIAIAFFAPGIVSAAEVTLAWDANTETDLAGYNIYYDISSGPPYYGTGADQGDSPITVLREDLDEEQYPEFTITGLEDDQDYYFALTAFDSDGNESDYSNEVSTAGGPGGGESSGGGGGGGCFIGTTVDILPWY